MAFSSELVLHDGTITQTFAETQNTGTMCLRSVRNRPNGCPHQLIISHQKTLNKKADVYVARRMLKVLRTEKRAVDEAIIQGGSHLVMTVPSSTYTLDNATADLMILLSSLGINVADPAIFAAVSDVLTRLFNDEV